MQSCENLQRKPKTKILDIRNIAQIGMLGGIAFVLMALEIPLWFAPGFYKLDFSEIPVLIGGFVMGPAAAALVELVKVLLYYFIHGSSTAGVGDFANLLIGCSLVLPAAFFYKYSKTKKFAAIGLACGTLAMTLVGSLLNAYLLLPLYAAVFHMPMSALIAAGTAVNPNITDLSGFIFLAVVPFNLLKGAAVSILTMLLYKRISPLLHGMLRHN